MRKAISIPALGLAVIMALSAAAGAAERVILSNGFEMNCKHHAQIGGHVRLYLGEGEENYVEFLPGEIAGVEQVPDPPIEKPATRSSRSARTYVQLKPADLHEMLATAGHAHNLDMDLLASLVKAESGGNAQAVSRAGAQGLMQLMPGTASHLGVEDSFEPRQSVDGGSVYLDALLTRYHDNLALALAAYNAGPAAVDKYHGIPPYPETRAYVARVIHEFNRRVAARRTRSAAAQASR